MRCFLFIFFLTLAITGYTMTSHRVIYGYVEKATLVDSGLVLSAKLDTGAKSASLSAINIQETVKDGKIWLTFTVPSKQGKTTLSGEYVGEVHIKVRSGENIRAKTDPIKRPVVLLNIKMGEEERRLRVNLTNRKRFNYPLLLGRDAIVAFSGLIDPSAAFLSTHLKGNDK